MNYRNTHIYRRSLEVVRGCHEVNQQLPRGCAFLADQLRRASSSIVLTFAEGCGKSSVAERRRYFRIARASAYEVAAALDVAAALGAVPESSLEALQDACDHVAAMLTRFARSPGRVQ